MPSEQLPIDGGDELQRRTRNLLAAVRALARRSAIDVSDVDTYVARFDGRLGAFARAHAAMLYQPYARVGLTELLLDELVAHAIQEGERIVIALPEVRLDAVQAGAFGLALHELIVHAIEHGAWSRADGAVSVTGSVADGMLHFTWQESVVPSAAAPALNTFAREYLEFGLAYDLGGSATLETVDALVFHCAVPLDRTRR